MYVVSNVGNYVQATHTGAMLYDPSNGPSGTDVATATYDPTKYDPNFVYLLTDNPLPATSPGEKQTLSAGIVHATRRKLFVHIMIHSRRHWAQLATLLRSHGLKTDWPQDFLFSEAMA